MSTTVQVRLIVNSLGQLPSTRISAFETEATPQLSEVVGEPVLAGVDNSSQLISLLAGQVIFGASKSSILIVKEQLADNPTISVTVQLTIV